MKEHCVLGKRQKAALEHRNRHARAGMEVQYAMRVIARRVDGAVDDKPGLVDLVLARRDFVPIGINLDEARRGNFVERPAERIDQKVGLARHPQRHMGVDQVGPAEVGYESVARSQIHAGSPLFGRTPGREGVIAVLSIPGRRIRRRCVMSK